MAAGILPPRDHDPPLARRRGRRALVRRICSSVASGGRRIVARGEQLLEGTLTLPEGPGTCSPRSRSRSSAPNPTTGSSATALHPARQPAPGGGSRQLRDPPASGTAIMQRVDFNTLDNPFAWTSHRRSTALERPGRRHALPRLHADRRLLPPRAPRDGRPLRGWRVSSVQSALGRDGAERGPRNDAPAELPRAAAPRRSFPLASCSSESRCQAPKVPGTRTTRTRLDRKAGARHLRCLAPECAHYFV